MHYYFPQTFETIMARFHEFIIIGSGFGGIGMAIQLQKAGHQDIKILEKAASLGGCWRDNTYPGAACDVPSHLYSYSFEQNFPWSRRFAPQKEILAYQQQVAAKYKVDALCQFNTEVTSAEFDQDRGYWMLTTNSQDTYECKFLIAATGQLSVPSQPQLEGLEDFSGLVFHSARWPNNLDLSGKKVAVVGTGASAIQFVPEVAKTAQALTLFQRSAPYVLPKPDRRYSKLEKKVLTRLPVLRSLERLFLYSTYETRVLGFGSLHKHTMKFFEQRFTRFLRQQIKDKTLREKLTPNYPMGCKRILMSNNYYPALAQPHVHVETQGIDTVTAQGIRTKDGVEHAADVIIFGTGFKAADFLSPIHVTGRNGETLDQAWQAGAEAYKGVSVAGFPNLFILYGPNTNLGHNSIIYMLESQFEYVLRCVSAANKRKARFIDVKATSMRKFNDAIQAQIEGTVWQAGCTSWYQNESGKNTNNWPTFTFRYRALTHNVNPEDYHFETA